LIPTKKIIFRTQLSQQEVMRRIRAQLDAPENDSLLHRFDGEVGDSTFIIRDMVAPRKNSFTPVVEGEVLRDETGTLIRVVMRMSGCVWTFVLVWCYPFALILLLSIMSAIRNGIGPIDKEAIFSIAFVIGMPAAMVTMTILGFRAGIRTAQAFIESCEL
jgi:hypothetical protein